ncbi:MAG: FkbM family methyltransferase [Anaerolineae bacterium]|nr:FkbM family methyltransferase [Anaerolineae bacterium]
MILSRWWYYLRSIPTLLGSIRERGRLLRAFAGWPPPAPFEITLHDGTRFAVRNRMDIWIIKETCLDRDYERHSVPVQDGWTVVDIGAALGDFAVSVARRLPGARVIAVEPFPESLALLQSNAQLNNVHNLEVIAAAVGAVPGEQRLALGSGVAVRHSTAQPEAGALRVPGHSLESLFEAAQVARCQFLKIDTEGAEYEILMQASPATLAKIDHICLEYHNGVTPYNHLDLVAFLEQQGFAARSVRNPAHDAIGFLVARRRVPGA